MSKSTGSTKEQPLAGVQQENGPQPLLQPGLPKTMLYREENPYLASTEAMPTAHTRATNNTPFIFAGPLDYLRSQKKYLRRERKG